MRPNEPIKQNYGYKMMCENGLNRAVQNTQKTGELSFRYDVHIKPTVFVAQRSSTHLQSVEVLYSVSSRKVTNSLTFRCGQKTISAAAYLWMDLEIGVVRLVRPHQPRHLLWSPEQILPEKSSSFISNAINQGVHS
jgi:hypothetical protein